MFGGGLNVESIGYLVASPALNSHVNILCTLTLCTGLNSQSPSSARAFLRDNNNKLLTMSGLHASPSGAGAGSSPLLVYTRYYYPLVLFFFFIISLTVWGIATSESSKPTPPPVNGIYSRVSRGSKKPKSETSTFKRIAARFPGGIPHQKDADELRLGPIRKAVLNWLLTGVLVTLVANAVNVIMHALTSTAEWWCGKDYVVCYPISSACTERLTRAAASF